MHRKLYGMRGLWFIFQELSRKLSGGININNGTHQLGLMVLDYDLNLRAVE
jgi:hypothetical protein